MHSRRYVITPLLTLGLAFSAFGQTTPSPCPANFAAGGISYSPGASPSIGGTGLYAHAVADTGTYAFTAFDALPTSTKPFTVTTQTSAGIAQRILTIAGVPVFVPTSAGVSLTGEHAGWAWTTGAAAVAPLGTSGWKLVPTLRVVKSSVSNGSGYQVVVGATVGWGW